MELYEAIEKRRTIREFKSAATEDQLRKIILAGTKAPSAVNKQPWEFVHVEDPEIIDQIANIKYELTLKNPLGSAEEQAALKKRALDQKASFKNASIVAVCNRVDWERSVWMCIENISLAATAEGLGSGIVLFWDEARHMAGEILGLSETHEVTAILKIGVPAEDDLTEMKTPMPPDGLSFPGGIRTGIKDEKDVTTQVDRLKAFRLWGDALSNIFRNIYDSSNSPDSERCF